MVSNKSLFRLGLGLAICLLFSACSDDSPNAGCGDCKADESCVNGVCVKNSPSDKPNCGTKICSENQICVSDTCVDKTSCASVSDCPSDQWCRAGYCELRPSANACEGDADCLAGKVCKGQVCSEPEAVDPCSLCTSSQNCENGKCVPKPDAGTKDSDGDGISDAWEGYDADKPTQSVDTDRDGTPDYLDVDSDNDGIKDSVEFNGGGNAENSLGDEPTDTDGDGIYDFRDIDSDANGVLDKFECVKDGELLDRNANGIYDCYDFDNDSDGFMDVDEIVGAANRDIPSISAMDCNGDTYPDSFGDGDIPRDCDGDGIEDYNSPDSDGDTIPDRIEGRYDSNGNGFLDRYSADSDGDGYLDAEEGITDADGNMTDTDNDTIPDYRSLDSDGDGLPDKFEKNCGAVNSRVIADADGDGYGDASEYAVEQAENCEVKPSDKCERAKDMLCKSDVGVKDFYEFYFELPENENAEDVLNFKPSVSKLDVMFNVDVTTSMGEEIKNLKNKMTVSIIPEINKRVSDSAIGVAEFADFPTKSYGIWSTSEKLYEDFPYRLLSAPSKDPTIIQGAVDKLDVRAGADAPESGIEALWQIVRGTGVSWTTDGNAQSKSGEVPKFTASQDHWGGVNFRKGTMPVVVHITDTLSHDDTLGGGTKNATYPYDKAYVASPHYSTQTLSALQDTGVRVISIYRPDTRQGNGSVGTLGIPTDAQLPQLVTISKETDARVPVCTFMKSDGNWMCGENKCCLLSSYAPGEGEENEEGVKSDIKLTAVAPDDDGLCTLSYFIDKADALSSTLIDGIDAMVKYATFNIAARVVGDPIEGSTKTTACFISEVEALKFIPPVQVPENTCTPTAIPTQLKGAKYNNGFTNFAAGTASSEIVGSQLEFAVRVNNNGCVKQKPSAQVFNAYIEIYDATTEMVLDKQTVSIIVPGKIETVILN